MPASEPPNRPPRRRDGRDRHVAFLDLPGATSAEVVARVAAVLAEMPAGSVLTVHADDPAARVLVPRWCEQSGHVAFTVIRHDERRSTFAIGKPG